MACLALTFCAHRKYRTYLASFVPKLFPSPGVNPFSETEFWAHMQRFHCAFVAEVGVRNRGRFRGPVRGHDRLAPYFTLRLLHRAPPDARRPHDKRAARAAFKVRRLKEKSLRLGSMGSRIHCTPCKRASHSGPTNTERRFSFRRSLHAKSYSTATQGYSAAPIWGRRVASSIRCDSSVVLRMMAHTELSAATDSEAAPGSCVARKQTGADAGF